MRFDELRVGMEYELKRSFSFNDVKEFAKLSLDTNPVHLDPEYAKGSIFKEQIVPGFLTASLFSAIIGTKMPGEGSVYLSQNVSFRKPVHLGQTIVAKVTIKGLIPDKQRALLSTKCTSEDGELMIDGTALVKIL